MSFIIATFVALSISSLAYSSMMTTTVEAKPIDKHQVFLRRIPPRVFSVAAGASMTIECEAFSLPPPNFHWLKNGKRIIQDVDENRLDDYYPFDNGLRSGEVPKGATRSRLFIDCVDSNDEAIYTCVAENAFSRVSASTKLSVLKQQQQQQLRNPTDNELTSDDGTEGNNQKGLSAIPQCLSEKNSRSSEPVRIHFWSHQVLEEQHKNAVLFCRSNVRKLTFINNNNKQSESLLDKLTKTPVSELVAAELQQQEVGQDLLSSSINNNNVLNKRIVPSSSWMLPDEKYVTPEMKDKFEIMENGDLLIKDLTWADMGNYICTVSDEFGSDSISTFVYPSLDKAPPKNKRALIDSNELDF